jgi:hypothetical protein
MSLIDDGTHWRARARESRIAADCMAEAGCRHIMLRIAASYEQIAARIDAQDGLLTRTPPVAFASGSPPQPSASPRAHIETPHIE